MKSYKICTLFLTSLFSSHAFAAITSGQVTGGTTTGSFVELSVPFTDSNPDNTVGHDTFQDPNFYGFNEVQNITLSQDIDVNMLAGGGSGVITAGTTVSSHYIFFDPLTSTSLLGDVVFDSNILGVITTTNKLLPSDSELGAPGVTYLNPLSRGLEANDLLTISALNSIHVDWHASSPGDFVRVITAASAVPVPAAIWLMGSGILGLIGVSRSKKI